MTPRKTNTYVGLDPEEADIVERFQRDHRCTAAHAIRALIRAGWDSQIASPRLTVEKENEGS